MKVSQLVGERFKSAPAGIQIESHALMVRGGYMRQVCNGVYSLYTPAKRIAKKIENIIREEMDAIDGQEVMFPVVMPASLWQESGRYETIGSEMARFKDRMGNPLVLGMTHEEAAVHLARGYGNSYMRYPFMIYQIQTKFRDEPRSRGGLIRVREFTMKDAYSFHTSQQDLEEYYYKYAYKAYERIFARAGVPEVISVKSDSGMMGGSVSHEFMLLTDIGEDSLAICTECDYRANVEVADCIVDERFEKKDEPLNKIATPEMKTIEDLAKFLKMDVKNLCKAVVYQRNDDDAYVIVFIRGDLEVNETKLRNVLQTEVHPAVEITENAGIVAGFIGPMGENAFKGQIVFDRSLQGRTGMVCGANEQDYHFTGLNMERDLGDKIAYYDVAKAYDGGVCPVCGKHSIKVSRGIEVGNIFQLGTKYTKAMEMQYQDADGNLQYPIMGCYGIGVGRLMASICEVRHDKYGPIWPMAIAPWQVQICALRAEEPEVRAAADALYEALKGAGLEVIFDDRPVSAGVMFSDADLLGVPVRVTISPKTVARQAMEVSARDKAYMFDLPLDGGTPQLIEHVRKLVAEAAQVNL